MSLVGTRPILPDELEQYELHHRARIAIKPGITGMWQVSGRSDITDFEEIVRLDTEYISQWNILPCRQVRQVTNIYVLSFCVSSLSSFCILSNSSISVLLAGRTAFLLSCATAPQSGHRSGSFSAEKQ